MSILTSLVGYRTIIFNVLMFLFAGAVQRGWIQKTPDPALVNQFIDLLIQTIPEIWAGGNIILRTMTTTPVGQGKPK